MLIRSSENYILYNHMCYTFLCYTFLAKSNLNWPLLIYFHLKIELFHKLLRETKASSSSSTDNGLILKSSKVIVRA